MVKIYDSTLDRVITEDQYAGNVLHFLYNTVLGRALLKMLFIQPWLWKLMAVLQKRRSTVARVNEYVATYAINKSDYVEHEWRSFYDFFNRKRTPGSIRISKSAKCVIAVAESKLIAVPITSGAVIGVKHRTYDLASIIGSHELATEYEGGIALVYRLSMHNYHRYIFADDGMVESTQKFKGVLHTVSSISNHYPVYSINQRQVSILQTQHFGKIAVIEVGAMMAGKIVNNPVSQFKRGQEKGSFEIGGSTILVIYKKATITLNDNIKKYSQKGIEVTVKIGEEIGNHA